MKKVRNMNVKLTYYARDTHPVIAKSDWMNVYFVVGVANAMHRLPRFGGVTEMPLFSDKVEHGSTNGRYHARGINRARLVAVDRNENLTQQSITRARYDDRLTRVDVSKSVDVPCEMVRLGCWCHAPARDCCESDNK